MKIFQLFAGVLLLTTAGFAQNKNSFNEADWLGTWKGNLIIITPGKSSSVNMVLTVGKTDTPGKYSWKTTYGEGAAKLEKNYFMIGKDIENGKWELDEDNTIIIDFFFGDNAFYSFFETKGILLSSRYELRNGKIIAEVTSSQEGKAIVSGTGDSQVISYPVYVIQKGELTREN